MLNFLRASSPLLAGTHDRQFASVHTSDRNSEAAQSIGSVEAHDSFKVRSSTFTIGNEQSPFGRADAADVHARPAPDRIESFESRNAFRGIGIHSNKFSTDS